MPPKYHILKEMGNGVTDQVGKFYPYQIAVATIPAKRNIRFYISAIWMSASHTGNGALAASVDKVEATIQSVTNVIAQVNMADTIAGSTVGSSVAVSNNNVNLLTDIGTAITVTNASSAGITCIQYAEIYEEAGEYQG
jgi:hypothetical protein